jgi:imidazolonepropionase-like amidohydrolase
LCCASAAAGDLRIEQVTIVSPEQPRVIRDATVYIRGERITSIYRSKQSSAARIGANDVEVINGKGLYIGPGLIDSRVHTGGVPGNGVGAGARES